MTQKYLLHIYIYIIFSVLSVFRRPFLKLHVQSGFLSKVSHFSYKVVMWN